MEKTITSTKTDVLSIIVYESQSVQQESIADQLIHHFSTQSGKHSLFIDLKKVTYNPLANIKALDQPHYMGVFTDYGLQYEHEKDKNIIIDSFLSVLDGNRKPYVYLNCEGEDCFTKAVQLVEQNYIAFKLGFSPTDFLQIYQAGIQLKDIQNQLGFFKKGIKKSILDRPARINDGIKKLSKQDVSYYNTLFDSLKEEKTLMKFVPASGAASRMFKFLSEFVNRFDYEKDTLNAYINKYNDTSMKVFLAGIDKFPFYDEVRNYLKFKYPDFLEWSREQRVYYFVKTLLQSPQYNFLEKPKAVLPFHAYPSHNATPIEEHLKEAVHYATSKGISQVHFTISNTHLDYFNQIVKEVKPTIEEENQVQIHVNFSYQAKSTDTLAVDMNNKPFRDEKGKLLFRPGGHGALIENLNQLSADIIFVKNIDNVTNGQLKLVVQYKKALAGILLELQQRIFHYLRLIEGKEVDKELLQEMIDFIQKELALDLHADFIKFKKKYKVDYLKELLNRPIRVCGMVRNEGEPGGGPFWIIDAKGKLSLQIVETSQVDTNDDYQSELLAESTHFNPVDLVCGTKDYLGNDFDLNQFVDENSGFIVQKNHKGKDLKSYELPGLWNGAMANWITIFVEVPLDTFNPVKTVNDLLKSAHQAE